MANRVALREADSVEIISLADNTVDFISTIEKKEVQQIGKWFEIVWAKHGEETFSSAFC